ncbi:hypothetical protein [Cesiribacter andamanensis]|uniref:Secreted protein n=1 Tax=Cesiribacter andamanensis AMV16 TaxID=1279009 RepID=M7N4E5_9BACT|nr:hypothetical protein [Cesiribacter andamanensis]EMR02096.1 hypothetical protein ADICEAN_02758 [Cesiribacter andamanensis AMV16]
MKTILPLLLLLGSLLACSPVMVNTLPPDPSATPTLESTLWVPEGLEILRLDYDAELLTEISEGSSQWEGHNGRAFVIAHARHRKSGEHYLLLYEAINRNTRPTQIIRFRPSAETP